MGRPSLASYLRQIACMSLSMGQVVVSQPSRRPLVPSPTPSLVNATRAPPRRVTRPALAPRHDPPPASGDTVILSLTQGDNSCPSPRSCPGADALRSICARKHVDFACATSWSTGMVGTVQNTSGDSIYSDIRRAARELCADCADSITLQTIRDSPLGM